MVYCTELKYTTLLLYTVPALWHLGMYRPGTGDMDSVLYCFIVTVMQVISS